MLGSDCFTRIEIRDLSTIDYSEDDIFDLTLPELKYVLRTRTAIGNTDELVFAQEPDPNIDVTLIYTSRTGTTQSLSIPYRYLPPEEYLDQASVITYDRFGDLLRRDKLHLAHGRALVYRRQHHTQGGRPIDCYAFAMAPKAFEDLTTDRRLEDGWAPESWSGIYVATRSMPTGIAVDRPITGSAGYWPRVFMLLHDNQVKFDVGRKTLQGQTKRMMQGVAKAVWDDILPYLQILTPTDSESVVRVSEQQKMDLFMEAEQWPKINFPAVQMINEPRREQMVVALFYELVGAGILKGYKTLRNNTYDQYDAFVLYEIEKSEIGRLEAAPLRTNKIEQRIIIEFKHQAESIIRDITLNNKRYRDINLLVCWELNSAVFENSNISVDLVPSDSVYYFGTTHMLYFPGLYQVNERLAVIELRSFLNQLQAVGRDASES